jgi:hypothetical protein
VLLLVAAVVVEARYAAEPIIPLQLFRDRTIALATVAAVLVGVTMLTGTTYLSEYFQTSRGMSPTNAGLMSLSMVVGLMVVSIVSGRVISATGLWKRWLVGGMVAVVVGAALLATIDHATPLWVVGAYMLVLGSGLGATQQNLILAVQNNVDQANIGAGSSVVTFFRTMGGAIGVSVFGAVLSHRVGGQVESGVVRLVADGQVTPAQAGALAHGDVPDVAALPGPLRGLFEGAFGDATGHIFLLAVPCAVLALVTVMFIKEKSLRTTLDELAEPEVVPELAAELEAAELGRR